MNDLERGLDRKRMLSWGGLLKQKHKVLNLNDTEDCNLAFCEIKIYLFGSYLRFKSVYKFLDIKLYDLPLFL